MKLNVFNRIPLKLSLLGMLLFCSTAFAGVTSLDNTFVANDQYASDFYSRLNRNFTQVLTGGVNNIQGANVANDSLLEANMADEINPRIRTAEGASCSNFVYTGLLPSTGASLTTDITAGTGYPLGYRIVKNSNTSHSYTASKWTWVDVDTNGDFHYTETAFGAAAPAVFANSMRLARVSSDSTTVNSVLDMRVTSCTTGPFSIIADATGESTLGDLLSTGNSGFAWGMNLVSSDTTHVTIKPGSMYINGQYRTVSTDLTVPISSTGSASAGTSGLDTGVVGANTTYYMYAAADQDAFKSPVGILSTSPTTPNGVTNFRKIGEVTTNAASQFAVASMDLSTVNYSGKIIQIKRKLVNTISTGTTALPLDDTPPLSTEGDDFGLTAKITPTNAANILKIDVVVYLANSTQANLGAALFKDSDGVAAAVGASSGAAAGFMSNIKFTHYIYADSTVQQTFKVRCGAGAGTTTINGEGGTRQYGGVLNSSITITEIQP